jgi:chromosome segregation ATPase
MEPTRLVQPIQNHIISHFLLGAASSALTRKNKMSLGEIYVILQNHFRSLTISRIQQSLSPGAQRIDLDDPTCLDLTRVLHDLRDKIHRREKQISNCNESIQEAERRLGDLTIAIRQKKQDIHKSNEKLRQTEDAIVEMIERQLELNIQREREITELTIAIAGLEQEISNRRPTLQG